MTARTNPRHYTPGEKRHKCRNASRKPIYQWVVVQEVSNELGLFWVKFVQGRNRRRSDQCALRQVLAVLNVMQKHIHGQTSIRRRIDCCREQPAAHPRLARLRQAVATGEWKLKPS